MKRFNLYISKYDWLVRVYVAVDMIDADEIVTTLRQIGCRGKDIRNARKNVEKAGNNGICYSNPKERISVMVIGMTTGADEFLNSMTHEISHLANHIALQDKISLEGEELCYLAGTIARMMYPFVRELLCEHCRESRGL